MCPVPPEEDKSRAHHAALKPITDKHDDLSHSVYDIAAVSLVPGPQRDFCLDWLIKHRNADETWGAPPQLSWYDNYICTYATAVAMRNAGNDKLADRALDKLPGIMVNGSPHMPETLTFGGLLGALDRFARAQGWAAYEHHPFIQRIIFEEDYKWKKMLAWDGFYDPMLSVAGYTGEKVYFDDRVDLSQYLDGFQSVNGSISNAPGASALTLLEIDRRNADISPNQVGHLRQYLSLLDPNTRSVGTLDFTSHFVTAWAIMYLSEWGDASEGLHIIQHQINEMHAHLHDGHGLRLLSPVGATMIPGDNDTTACAIWAVVFAGRQIANIDKLEGMYVPDKGYYQTFLFERDASLSTNIHMAMLLAMYNSPRLDPVLDWLSGQVAQSKELICKWHASPIYTIGEIARVMAHIDHPSSRPLFLHAMQYLLYTQHDDGGWGSLNSTTEETGYAVLGLAAIYENLITHLPDSPRRNQFLGEMYQALMHAEKYLYNTPIDYTPLWIGKSLYCVKPLVPVLHEACNVRIRQIRQKYGK